MKGSRTAKGIEDMVDSVKYAFGGRRGGKVQQAADEVMEALKMGRVYIPDLKGDSSFLQSLRKRMKDDAIEVEFRVVKEPKELTNGE